MSIIHKVIGVLLWVIFVGLIVTMFYSCYWLGTSMCGNYIHAEHVSPDGRWKAVVFQRDCGATTGFSTQISILEAHENLPNDKGNIFIINGHPEDVALKLEWLTNEELKVMRKLDGHEYKAETSLGWFNKVAIVYE